MPFEKQRTVDISAWDYDRPVVLKRLLAGENEAFSNECAKYSIKPGKRRTVEVDPLMGTAALLYVQYCTVEAPWENTLDELRKLDGTLIDHLYEQALEVNTSPLARPNSST